MSLVQHFRSRQNWFIWFCVSWSVQLFAVSKHKWCFFITRHFLKAINMFRCYNISKPIFIKETMWTRIKRDSLLCKVGFWESDFFDLLASHTKGFFNNFNFLLIKTAAKVCFKRSILFLLTKVKQTRINVNVSLTRLNFHTSFHTILSNLWPNQHDLQPYIKGQTFFFYYNNTHMSLLSASVLPQAQLMFRQHRRRRRPRQSASTLLGQFQSQLQAQKQPDPSTEASSVPDKQRKHNTKRGKQTELRFKTKREENQHLKIILLLDKHKFLPGLWLKTFSQGMKL